jgi:hypothetical protein
MKSNPWSEAPPWAKQQALNFKPTVDCLYWLDDEGYMVAGTTDKIQYTDAKAYQPCDFLIINSKPNKDTS